MVHTGNYYYLLNVYTEQLRLIFLEEYDIIESFLDDLAKVQLKDKKLYKELVVKLSELRNQYTKDELKRLKQNVAISLHSLICVY
jgi:hypothetical protein